MSDTKLSGSNAMSNPPDLGVIILAWLFGATTGLALGVAACRWSKIKIHTGGNQN